MGLDSEDRFEIVGILERIDRYFTERIDEQLKRPYGEREGIEKKILMYETIRTDLVNYLTTISQKLPENTGENNTLNEPVTSLNLKLRALNCLESENIRTIGKLANMTKVRLMSIRNLGRTTFDEITSALKEHYNLELRKNN